MTAIDTGIEVVYSNRPAKTAPVPIADPHTVDLPRPAMVQMDGQYVGTVDTADELSVVMGLCRRWRDDGRAVVLRYVSPERVLEVKQMVENRLAANCGEAEAAWEQAKVDCNNTGGNGKLWWDAYHRANALEKVYDDKRSETWRTMRVF